MFHLSKLGTLVLLASSALFAEVGARISLSEEAMFSPNQVEIRVGQSVEFTNISEINHTVTADPRLVRVPENVILPAGAKPFHSGKLTPGQVFNQTFTVAGTYQFVCLPHELHGMIGRVIVK